MLTTQLKQLMEQLNSMKVTKSSATTATLSDDKKETLGTGKFEEWQLMKVNNKEEHNLVEQDGKKWYWCSEHYHNNQKCRMYCTHMPGDGHVKWQEHKSSWKRD